MILYQNRLKAPFSDWLTINLQKERKRRHVKKNAPYFIVLLCVLFTACGPREKAAEPVPSVVESLSSSETQTSLAPSSSAAPNTSQPAPASSVASSNTSSASSSPKTTPAKKEENSSIEQNAPYVFKLPETGLEIKHINQQYKIADSSNLERNFFSGRLRHCEYVESCRDGYNIAVAFEITETSFNNHFEMNYKLYCNSTPITIEKISSSEEGCSTGSVCRFILFVPANATSLEFIDATMSIPPPPKKFF